ncbi:MAG: type II toxin-antitoxin system RelE/ParE family toxin [Candidatus Bathyarchaeia archaeon]
MEYYNVLLKKSVDKDLRRIDPAQIPRIVEAIRELAKDPFPSGSRKLRGTENLYRIRIGDYRIVYEIDNESKTITIHYIRHRRIAYG